MNRVDSVMNLRRGAECYSQHVLPRGSPAIADLLRTLELRGMQT